MFFQLVSRIVDQLLQLPEKQSEGGDGRQEHGEEGDVDGLGTVAAILVIAVAIAHLHTVCAGTLSAFTTLVSADLPGWCTLTDVAHIPLIVVVHCKIMR